MPLAVVGYALLGGSRHLFVGPSATSLLRPSRAMCGNRALRL
jgi:hypothetical protein